MGTGSNVNVTVGAILHLILTEALKDFVFEVEEDLLRKASSRFSYQKGPGLGPVFKVNMRLAIGRGGFGFDTYPNNSSRPRTQMWQAAVF